MKQTLTVTFEGRLYKRTTANDYRFVVFGRRDADDTWGAIRWSSKIELAGAFAKSDECAHLGGIAVVRIDDGKVIAKWEYTQSEKRIRIAEAHLRLLESKFKQARHYGVQASAYFKEAIATAKAELSTAIAEATR